MTVFLSFGHHLAVFLFIFSGCQEKVASLEDIIGSIVVVVTFELEGHAVHV